MKTTTNATIKIFVTNLGKYNEGQLIGEWLSLPATDEQIAATLDKIGIDELYEEYFITDSESDFADLSIKEYSNIDELNELAERITDLDECELEALKAYLEVISDNLEDALDCIECGAYSFYADMELEDLAREFVEEGGFGEIPDSIAPYIDYEAIARDLGFDSYYEALNGVIYAER